MKIEFRVESEKTFIGLTKSKGLAKEERSVDQWISLKEVDGLSEQDADTLCLWVAQQMPFLDGEKDYDERSTLNLPECFRVPKEAAEEMIIFPGSFNPWHLGHQACLEQKLDAPIIVIPDQNPWKTGENTKNSWSQVRDLVNRFEGKKISLYPGFLPLKEGNPSWSWIPKVRSKCLGLLVGDDSFLSLLKWQRPEVILKTLSSIYVVPRMEAESILKAQEKRVKDLFPHLKISFLDHHEYESLSSTKERL